MDPISMHRAALDEFSRVLDQVGDDDLTTATPCDDWSVADLVEHAIVGNLTVAERMTGTPPALERTGDRNADFRAAADLAHAAFAADGALDGTVELPFGVLPVVVWVAIRSGDQYAHAWDLATAVGADTDLDHEVGEAVHTATAPILSPDLRGDGRPFAAEQNCPPDRPIADRYAAFLGRVVPT